MRTLSASLLAAQQSMDTQPGVSVLVGDCPPEAPRLAALTLVDNTGADQVFDTCFTDTGLIGRCRWDGAGNVYAQAVNPSSPSWSTWTLIDTGASAFANTAPVCLYGSQDGSGKVWFFYVLADGHRIAGSSSTNGAAWSTPTVQFDAGAGFLVGGLGADGMDPTLRLFYVRASDQLFETHWNGSAWSAPVGDGGSWGSPHLAVGFRPTTAPNGDGNAYCIISNNSATTLSERGFNITTGTPGWQSTINTLQQAGTGTSYAYYYPKLSESTAATLRQVVCWSEVAPSPIGTQAMIAVTPTHTSIQGVVPWRYTANHGIKVFQDVGAAPNRYWWVINSNQVYRCIADTGTYSLGQRVRFFQNQVVELRLEQNKVNETGRGQVTVLNEGGALKTAGQAGIYLALRQWSQCCVTLGYQTGQFSGFGGLPAGQEGVWQQPYWIETITFHDDVASGMPLVTFGLVDAWGILEEVHFRIAVTYTSQTVEYILDRIIWYVSGQLTGSGNARLSAITLSAFTVRAGESLANVVRRLAELAAVAIVFHTNPNAVDGVGLDTVLWTAVNWGSGGSVYSYAVATDGKHPILQSEIEPYVSPSATSVQVAGSTTWSQARNWTQTWLLWRDIVSSVVDKTLATQGATDTVAGNMATLFVPEGAGGSLHAFANVGLELGDQIDVTIATAPITTQVFTVESLIVSWSWSGGELVQTVGLEGTN